MGQIHEEFILTDSFSAAFSRFLNMGQSVEKQVGRLDISNQQFAQSSNFAAQQMDAMRSSLSAQQTLFAAQNQRLEAQKQKVEQLSQKYQKLASDKGAEAASTIRANEALARAQITEQNILRQVLRTSEAIERQNNAIQDFSSKMNRAEAATKKTAREQEKHNQRVQETAASSDRLLTTVKQIAGVLAGIKIGGDIIKLSDTMTQTKARLNLMNDGLQSTEQLQQMIYRSAQRSRTEYAATADVVAKLGQRAGSAFGSSAEVVQFAENLNKQFKIAGASQAEISSASLQLTQALGSGVLQGEELNAVFEAAPNVIQNIAKYIQENDTVLSQMAEALDIDPSDMSGNVMKYIRDIASEGLLSAGIVKNAMLSATNQINEDFESIPKTYEDAWVMVKNAGVDALDEVSGKLNDFLNSAAGDKVLNGVIGGFEILASVASGTIDLLTAGAGWVIENWDYVYPVLIGIAAALAVAGAMGMASGMKTAAGWAMANWQVLAIGAGVAALIFILRQAGVSWQEMGQFAGGTLAALYSVAYTIVAACWNLFATFAEFFANVFNDPVAAIAHLFFDLFDNILNTVETVASAIDALLGSDLTGAVSGFRGKLSSWVDDTFGENAVEIKRMGALDIPSTIDTGIELGGNLGSKMDNLNFNLESLTDGLGGMDFTGFSGLGDDLGDIGKVGSVGSVKNVEGDIKLSDEDLKVYQDLAERRYMNQIELKTLAPEINITIPGANGDKTDAKKIGDYLKKVLIEQMNSQTSIAHG